GSGSPIKTRGKHGIRERQIGHETGFVQYAPILLLQTGPPQDVRGQNIAIKASFRKSLAEHPYVLRRDALRLARVPKHHFRQSVLGNLFKGLESQSTHSGLNCSYPVTGPGADLYPDANVERPGQRSAPGPADAVGPLAVVTKPGGVTDGAGAGGTARAGGGAGGPPDAPRAGA